MLTRMYHGEATFSDLYNFASPFEKAFLVESVLKDFHFLRRNKFPKT